VIDLPVAMTIPEEYIADTNLRLDVYRRAARAEDEEGLLEELRDRFGEPPASVRTLVAAGRLKAAAESAGIQSIAARRGALQIRLRRDSRVDLDRLVRWIGERDGVAFSPSGILTVRFEAGADVLALAREVLRDIVGGS
jgi:transcription-repair coupling factor (superfamily II helicase)